MLVILSFRYLKNPSLRQWCVADAGRTCERRGVLWIRFVDVFVLIWVVPSSIFFFVHSLFGNDCSNWPCYYMLLLKYDPLVLLKYMFGHIWPYYRLWVWELFVLFLFGRFQVIYFTVRLYFVSNPLLGMTVPIHYISIVSLFGLSGLSFFSQLFGEDNFPVDGKNGKALFKSPTKY